MAIMPRVLVGLIAGAALIFAACGGGSEGDDDAPEITDPAEVPTSTPIREGSPVVYTIRGDIVSAEGQSGTVTTTPVAPANQSETYTIAEGDTCTAIAEQFGVSVAEIVEANPGVNDDCSNLFPGDTVKIPSTATATATTTATATPTPGSATTPTPTPTAEDGAGGTEYVVQEGDICSTIADQFGVSAQDIIAANGLNADCSNLVPGQTITIP